MVRGELILNVISKAKLSFYAVNAVACIDIYYQTSARNGGKIYLHLILCWIVRRTTCDRQLLKIYKFARRRYIHSKQDTSLSKCHSQIPTPSNA